MSEKGGSVLLVAPLTPSPPLELLESPTVRRLSNNFRGGGGGGGGQKGKILAGEGEATEAL